MEKIRRKTKKKDFSERVPLSTMTKGEIIFFIGVGLGIGFVFSIVISFVLSIFGDTFASLRNITHGNLNLFFIPIFLMLWGIGRMILEKKYN